MNGFNEKLAQVMGVEKINGLDKFSLFGGSIGLLVDTSAIIGLARGLIIPNIPKPVSPPEGGLLITALLGFYFLGLLIWFLIRFERAKRNPNFEKDHRAFDELRQHADWEICLIPILGVFGLMKEETTQVILFLSVFIAFLPVTLWIYALTSTIGASLFTGLFASILFAQYATFFAMTLDKFFY
jgi:hypothetical protein